MDFKEFKLSALLEISKAINSNLAPQKLFLLLKFFLKNQLKIQKGLLIDLDNQSAETLLSFGENTSLSADQLEFIKTKKDIFYLQSSSNNPIPQFEALIPILHNFKIVAHLLVGDFKLGENFEVSPVVKNLRFIQTLANPIVVAVQNKKLEQERLENIKLNRDLELASEIQKLLIPTNLPKTDKFSVSAIYKPQNKIGGDYYDVIKVSDEKYFFCLADISGKGISAALIMANFQAILRGNIPRFESLKEFVIFLNQKTCELTNQNYFITFFGGFYNLKTNIFTYINTAHFPPILKTSTRVVELYPTIPGLGMLDILPKFDAIEFLIDEPTSIVAYTDRATDVTNEKDEFFGEGRLMEMIKNANYLKPEDTINNIVFNLVNYAGKKGTFTDDLTLFALELKN